MLGSKGKTHPRVWRVGVGEQVIDAGSSYNVVKDLRPTSHKKSKNIAMARNKMELELKAFLKNWFLLDTGSSLDRGIAKRALFLLGAWVSR